MTTITISQTGPLTVAPNVALRFGGEPPFPVTVVDPFTPAEEAQLAWYFEEWLTFPFTEGVKAQTAAATGRRYGETLFRQLFLGDERAYSRYREAVAQGVATCTSKLWATPTFTRSIGKRCGTRTGHAPLSSMPR